MLRISTTDSDIPDSEDELQKLQYEAKRLKNAVNQLEAENVSLKTKNTELLKEIDCLKVVISDKFLATCEPIKPVVMNSTPANSLKNQTANKKSILMSKMMEKKTTHAAILTSNNPSSTKLTPANVNKTKRTME